MGFWGATFILTKKNVLLSVRDYTTLIVALSASFFAMLVLYFSQISIDNGEGFAPELLDNPNPEAHGIGLIPRCVPFETADCLTFAYVPADDENVEQWIDSVSIRNSIPRNETMAFASGKELNEYLFDNPNRTQAAYIFDNDSLEQINGGNVSFIVQYNETLQFEFPLDETDFHTQVVVPSMVHQMNLELMRYTLRRTVDISLSASVFPHPNIISLDNSNNGGLDAFGLHGDFLTFATYFLSLIFFLYRIISEKERGLRDALKLAGQLQSQHFISWCLPYFVFNTILTLLLIAFGHAFRFKYFTVSSFFVYFLTFFIFSLSLIGWTMLVASLLKKSTSVSGVAFALFTFGYIIGSAGSIVYSIDENGEPRVSESVFFLRQLFAVFPTTMFVKAIYDGNILALQGIKISFSEANSYISVFPMRECWVWMAGSGGVALALSIYFDNVISTGHGVPLKPHYFLQSSYWGLGKKKQPTFGNELESRGDESEQSDEGDRQGQFSQSYDPDSEDADVRYEREAILRGQRDSAALVIKNISKKFRKLTAVDNVSFSVRKDTAFALLGSNGAGKSTLFNMLVTVLSPSAGDAFIYGLSVREDPAAVRKLLGVCPQFDLFWEKLTGAEHIELFAALKGLSKKEWENEIVDRLEDVDLLDVANVLAGTYSGGMQRRLSVALSLTGDPKIVLLDECTSGADPHVRQDLWRAIERAKKGRVVFLITHSIAEAQQIAGRNQIGIMAKGKLRVLGNALHLKTKFGVGYRLSVILHESSRVEFLTNALSRTCPGSLLISSENGDKGETIAKYGLPRHATESEVLQSVQLLEDQKEELHISDYSINSSTLGEVFTSITSLSEDAHEDETLETKKRCCF
ncbi:ABC transporter A family member 2 [Gracilariopsis chorda]|uniref:Probable ATP-dependent transporter ycf16 n=1 Tax=Gracilariopsis chorda TaxID=448386 RepID=A0A2V3INH2_9FLOR|nr:ABC transporter A family member 2 [Gracilariopsis chorda]|eukprot:PXF43607.1 ABC transporter A family member 2 [Gracilariopsis chorda]